MYRVKSPLRVSFFGGGSDYPSFLEENEGNVFGASVNLYCHWELIKCVNTPTSDEFAKPIVEFFNDDVTEGYSLATNSDQFINSGLGASSASLNALVTLLDKMNSRTKDHKSLVESVLKVERNYFRKRIGMQDPILSAYGGLNHVTFSNDNFSVNRVENRELIEEINSHLYLVKVAPRKEQQTTIKSYTTKSNSYPLIRELSKLAKEVAFKSSDPLSIHEFSKYLQESWKLKKELSPLVSSGEIDLVIEKLLNKGALGVKLLGAGGGGVLAVLIPKDKYIEIKEYFRSLSFFKVEIESRGVHLDLSEV